MAEKDFHIREKYNFRHALRRHYGQVARTGYFFILVLEVADIGVFLHKSVHDLKGIVGAAIVHIDKFPVLVGLIYNAFDTVRQVSSPIVGA